MAGGCIALQHGFVLVVMYLYLVLVVVQLKVLPRDLQLCSETASGVDAGGQHEWGELVQLEPQTVGVIVRLERETFQVHRASLSISPTTQTPHLLSHELCPSMGSTDGCIQYSSRQLGM